MRERKKEERGRRENVQKKDSRRCEGQTGEGRNREITKHCFYATGRENIVHHQRPKGGFKGMEGNDAVSTSSY